MCPPDGGQKSGKGGIGAFAAAESAARWILRVATSGRTWQAGHQEVSNSYLVQGAHWLAEPWTTLLAETTTVFTKWALMASAVVLSRLPDAHDLEPWPGWMTHSFAAYAGARTGVISESTKFVIGEVVEDGTGFELW